MAGILEILGEFLKEIEKDNPYRLIGKGGTILALLHLGAHRESEDLDFDTATDKSRHREIESYFLGLLERLKQNGVIKDYHKGKSGMAATNRYHMKLELETHKTFYTKIDVDFIGKTDNLKMKGKLRYYSLERLFVGKAVAFVSRTEFKDIYDIAHMLGKIDIESFRNNKNVIELLDSLIESVQKKDALALYKAAFRNVDLHFKDVKEHDTEKFVANLIRDLRVLRNRLCKREGKS
ncbi:nucleotidyl transferase AbiEii/AbiGii toxin family protein [Candidatus Woesearchaeota archaeon]|nr:nucleotidyl transferase AbiEii/AbiGii toxin family protein [Candidatus Woesearchaeota archaeon]